MKNLGRKMVKAILFGGAVVTSFAVNSTNSMAEEVDSTGDEPQMSLMVDDINQIAIASKYEAMKDAVEVIEGDAIAEEGYLNQANESVEKNEMTDEAAKEILAVGSDVMNQAEEKKNVVDSLYDEVVQEADESEGDFVSSVKNFGLSGVVDEIEQATSDEEKIEVAVESVKSAEKKYEEETNKKNEEYEDINIDILICRSSITDIESEIEGLSQYLKDLDVERGELYREWSIHQSDAKLYKEEYARITSEISEVDKALDELQRKIDIQTESYNEVLESLNDMLEELRQAEERLEAEAAKLNDMFERGEYDDSEYQAELEKYNVAMQNVNERSEELGAISKEYRAAKEEYDTKKDERDEYNQALENLQEWYDAMQIDDKIKECQELEEDINREEAETRERISENGKELAAKQQELEALNKKLIDIEQVLKNNKDNYESLCKSAEKYISALKYKSNASGLNSRANIAYEKTTQCYQNLKKCLDEYLKEKPTVDVDEIYKSMQTLVNDIEKEAADEKEYAKSIEAAVDDDALTLGNAYVIMKDYESKYTNIKCMNEQINENFAKISEEVERAQKKYNSLEGILGSMDDVSSEEYEKLIEEFNLAKVNYTELENVKASAAKLVDDSQKQLQDASESYNKIKIVLDGFFVDVMPVEQSYDFTEGNKIIRIHFSGMVKGNFDGIDEHSYWYDIVANIRGCAGEITVTIFDRNGEVGSFAIKILY